MSETTDKEDEILEEAICYVVAVSRGQNYKYPKGWDKNMKRAVRKRAERVVVRGMDIVYKKKDKAEVRIVQSREEQKQILDMLSCDVINRAQSLLKKQFPGQNGLQSNNALKEKKTWQTTYKQWKCNKEVKEINTNVGQEHLKLVLVFECGGTKMVRGNQNSNQIGSWGNQFGCCFGSGGP